MLVEFRTSECHQFGQPEFRFKVDDTRVLEIDIQWFIKTLHEWIAHGERFRDSETVQLGWGLLKVHANPDGSLALLEPDYSSMPVNWVDTITQTLRDLRTQKDVCESYFEPDETTFPSFREHCIACSRLKDSPRIIMERVAATSPDSGWFIGCRHEEHDHNNADQLRRVSLYEAVLENPRARKFVALPPGTLLEADDEDIRLYHADALVNPKRGSYVHRLLSGSAV